MSMQSMHLCGASRRVFLVFLALLALGASAAVHATTVEKMTLSEVVDGSEVIAVGRVAAIQETWDAVQEMPYREVTFSVLEVLKGEVGRAELTLQFLGGPTPDGLTLEVAGMPRFDIGDRTIVFSAGNGVYACPLVGWWQGLYRLLFDLGTETFTVVDHAWRPVVAVDGGVGRLAVRLLAGSNDELLADAFTLDEFSALVRAELR